MVTLVVYAVLALVVVAALVAVAVLLLPATEQLAPAPADRTPWALPTERAMTGPDVGRLRLPVTLRGYRFAETDAVLDRLGEEIAYRDAVIATLRAELEGGAVVAGAEGEVLVSPLEADPVDGAVGVDGLDDEPAVELGETPEETEHEVPLVEDVPAVDVDAPVDVVEVVEVVEVVDVVEVDEVEPGPQVVALDDEFPEFSDVSRRDDTAPEGPART